VWNEPLTDKQHPNKLLTSSEQAVAMLMTITESHDVAKNCQKETKQC
jgi:hypothetical protein